MFTIDDQNRELVLKLMGESWKAMNNDGQNANIQVPKGPELLELFITSPESYASRMLFEMRQMFPNGSVSEAEPAHALPSHAESLSQYLDNLLTEINEKQRQLIEPDLVSTDSGWGHNWAWE